MPTETRHKGIIAYGTELDREKLAVLSQLNGMSGSEYLVHLIRSNFQNTFGNADPKLIVPHR